MSFTPEMHQWLTDNREDYEFYMLHAMMHDPLLRTSLLNTPVLPDDFRREEYSLVVGSLHRAVKITNVFGQPMPTPPSPEFLRTYVQSAAREEGSDEEMIELAMKLIKELKSEKFKEQHYCVSPYFEAWYGSVRAKQAARDLLKVEIPDFHAAVNQIENAAAAAAMAVSSEEDDAFFTFVKGTATEREPRKPTGLPGLDECLNGGWGRGESYLVFSGTSGGKSILAGQCAFHEATQNDGYPLIISTELEPREYCVRMISCGCAIPINLLQDCENFAQVHQAVTSDPGLLYKMPVVKNARKTISDRVYISKVSADDGMDARAILQRELLRYELKFHRKPTWVCLDWLGSVADLSTRGRGGSAERAMDWEYAATGCVKFAETSGIPTLVLAQAVNDTQGKRVLTIADIGISKGIGKNMTAVIGLTNSIDKAASSASADTSRPMFHQQQRLCVCKSRKGEGRNIPIQRDFLHQRFIAPSKEDNLNPIDETVGSFKPDKNAECYLEVEEVYGSNELLRSTDLCKRIAEVRKITPQSAKPHIKKYLNLGLIEIDASGKYRIVRSPSVA